MRVAAFKEPVVGRVDLIDSQVNESTQTIKVRVRVANDHGRLKPGMFAAVEIELPAGRKAILVPKKAVLSNEGRHFVFQHWKEDLWLQRHVVLGRSNGERVEVVSGIEPGATLVTGGAFVLKSDVLRAKMGAGCAD